METKGRKGGSQHRGNNQGAEFIQWLITVDSEVWIWNLAPHGATYMTLDKADGLRALVLTI